MEAVQTEEYRRYKIGLYYDEDSESPRKWDNICVFHIAHRRYSFGDKNYNDAESIHKAERRAKARGDIVLPLYMYDHSGITIALTPFSCRWDSSQVGFVAVPRLKMIEEFGKKIFTPKLKVRALEIAEAEVKEMDMFCTGQVYGFKVFGPMTGDDDDDDCREELEACWGFYGEEYAIEEAKGSIDWAIAAPKRERDKCSSLYL